MAARSRCAAQRRGADEVLGVQRADPAEARPRAPFAPATGRCRTAGSRPRAAACPSRPGRTASRRRPAGRPRAVTACSGSQISSTPGSPVYPVRATIAGTPHTSARVKPNGRQLRKLDQRQRGRALQREHRQLGRPVVHRHVGRQALGQPGAVGVGAAGIDDQQQVVVGEPVDDQVVHRAARVLEQQRVLGVPRADPVEVVGQRRLRKPHRPRTAQLELSHVRHVEDARVAAHRQVLRDDALVLHRHLPARKGNDPRAGRKVAVVEGCPAQRGLLWHPEAQSTESCGP